MRGYQTERTAQVICAEHGLVRNLAGGHYRLGVVVGIPAAPEPPLLMRAGEELTELLLAG
jgi:hypothetical protein